ncbi:hypothetical protein CHU98_g1600 [Xylaria longipes]|nr:hypothetical protein CHU98_g1600 [Xylaria longipes]
MDGLNDPRSLHDPRSIREPRLLIVDALAEMRQSIYALDRAVKVIATGLCQDMQLRPILPHCDLDDIRVRIFNATAHGPQQILLPYKNLVTHQLVRLPSTVRGITALPESTVVHSLLALGQTPRGSEKENMAQLLGYILGVE